MHINELKLLNGKFGQKHNKMSQRLLGLAILHQPKVQTPPFHLLLIQMQMQAISQTM
jgi:hypothetical protein